MEVLIIISLVIGCSISIPIPSTNPEEGKYFEGDMELTPQQMKAINEAAAKHTFGAIKSDLWMKDGKADVIDYYVGRGLWFASSVIKDAIKGIESKTCIRFRKVRRKPSGPHIYFTSGAGCSSPVGKQPSGNRITLDWGCLDIGKVQHEIGHSIGFYHEQSRPDRDSYVEVMWNNVKKGHEHNFQKYGTDRIDSRGFAYDLDSMMHYPGNFFAKDETQLTLRTRDPKQQGRIGQRKGISMGDAAQLNNMYKC